MTEDELLAAVAAAAADAGLARTAACRSTPDKYCTADEWRGNLAAFAAALLRRADPAASAPGKDAAADAYPLYRRLIGPLREAARQNGYALAVHGSLRRDIDLVAVPWQEPCAHPACLAEDLTAAARAANGGVCHLKPAEEGWYFVAGCPGAKPHGRLVWSLHLGGGPYLDLSVVPPRGVS